MSRDYLELCDFNDWPSTIMHGVPRSDEMAVAARLVTNVATFAEGAPSCKACLKRDDVNLAGVGVLPVHTASGSTFPAVVLRVDGDHEVLRAFFRQRLAQRSVLHPGTRHVLICLGVEAADGRVVALLRRAFEEVHQTTVFLLLAEAIGRVPIALRERCAHLNVSRLFRRDNDLDLDLDVVDSLRRAMSSAEAAPLAHVEKLARAVAGCERGQFARTVSRCDASLVELAARADALAAASKSWVGAAHYLAVCACQENQLVDAHEHTKS